MPTQSPPLVRLEKLFNRRKCWMVAQLAQTLGWALITVRRLLKQIGYFRSYTHNGKWYTLRGQPEFDRQGLWRHRGIGFSQHGSLTATILHWVRHSPNGLSAAELALKLGYSCHAVLTQLHKNGQLDRVKVGGEFQYLCTEEPINRRQRGMSEGEQPSVSTTTLNTQAAVFVLVEYIKNPGMSLDQISDRVQRQHNITLTPQSVAAFFEEHDLKKTRETSNSRR